MRSAPLPFLQGKRLHYLVYSFGWRRGVRLAANWSGYSHSSPINGIKGHERDGRHSEFHVFHSRDYEKEFRFVTKHSPAKMPGPASIRGTYPLLAEFGCNFTATNVLV
ncbi:hypothetical protein TKK_0000268 [Trichogramma kaykai]